MNIVYQNLERNIVNTFKSNNMKTLIVPSNFDLIVQILIFIVIFGIGFAVGCAVTVNYYFSKNKPKK